MPLAIVWRLCDPSEVFTFGAVLQTGRLFGAQLGSAFVQTFVRTREQTYSNLIGLHINTGSLLTDQRLQDYAKAVADRSTGEPQANARAIALLARSVQNQAYCSHTLTASWFSASPSSGPCCSCCCFAIRRHTTASMVNSDRAG